jgi:uncharacterized OB-fold protein
VSDLDTRDAADLVDVTDRPLPKADPVTAPFWEATLHGELLIQRCPACGWRQFYPRALCTACAATPEWEVASGRGVVHTFSVVRQNPAPPFRQWRPYTVAIVELDEGVRMMTELIGVAAADVAIGMEVEVAFVPAADDVALPFFRPLRAPAGAPGGPSA